MKQRRRHHLPENGGRNNVVTQIEDRMAIVKKVFRTINIIAQFLVLLGALNWGLYGLNKTDAIVVFFPRQFVRYVHITVGIAALYLILVRLL